MYLCIALGSALGGLARHWMTTLASTSFRGSFPSGTLAVNLLGSLLIGVIAGISSDRLSPTIRSTLTIGVLGGFTTFSAFSFQTASLFKSGQSTLALLYACASVVACPLLAWLGWRLAERFI
jgi:fluoride exporter